jgi:hypothetical protein
MVRVGIVLYDLSFRVRTSRPKRVGVGPVYLDVGKWGLVQHGPVSRLLILFHIEALPRTETVCPPSLPSTRMSIVNVVGVC